MDKSEKKLDAEKPPSPEIRIDWFQIASYFLAEESLLPEIRDIPQDQFNFKNTMTFGISEDLANVRVGCSITMSPKNDIDHTLLSLSTLMYFGIKNAEFYTDKGFVLLPETTLAFLTITALSTTRGVMFAKNFGTAFERIILPIFDIKKLLPQKPLQYLSDEQIGALT
ncbi:MAG: hypothetical protein Q8916_06875 [Bacteroidota bacterium]|nr:hypothetical protein [Bacteroidota bacterium]MDP4237100.1 hypothetical protein [Bacteroidota bacterium]